MSFRSDAAVFRSTRPGIEYLPGRFSLPRHRHFHPYVSIVLSGSFDESGYIGRIRAIPGDVLIHPVMDCHANQMVSSGVRLLRLDWPVDAGQAGYYRLDEVELLARSAERDPAEASALLRSLLQGAIRPAALVANDWPDELAVALRTNRGLMLGEWARSRGMAAETISRGFKAAYGVSPATFRAERRARRAWLLATRSDEKLSTIATTTGFADQAHMTRWVHRVTGAPPSKWRRDRGSASP
jgi:AraC-like DNA-binding protein